MMPRRDKVRAVDCGLYTKIISFVLLIMSASLKHTFGTFYYRLLRMAAVICVRKRVYVINAHCHLGNSISCPLSCITLD